MRAVQDLPALAFGQATPQPVLHAVAQRVREAFPADRTRTADGFRAVLLDPAWREEDLGIGVPAGSLGLPIALEFGIPDEGLRLREGLHGTDCHGMNPAIR